MVEIVAYKPSWQAEFREIAISMREVLSVLATRIDHIGSTAVPDIIAKDVIDIQITVDSMDERIQQALESLGYVLDKSITHDHRPADEAGPDSEWSKCFFRAPQGQRATNTHVRLTGHANQRYALLFRDYLRSHPASAASYGRLKIDLAKELSDPSRYPVVKDAAVDLIYHAANEWARATNWQLSPPDA